MKKRPRAVYLYAIDKAGPRLSWLLFWRDSRQRPSWMGSCGDVCVLSWSLGLREGRVPVCVCA